MTRCYFGVKIRVMLRRGRRYVKKVSVYLDEELYDFLAEMCVRTKRSASEIIRSSIISEFSEDFKIFQRQRKKERII